MEVIEEIHDFRVWRVAVESSVCSTGGLVMKKSWVSVRVVADSGMEELTAELCEVAAKWRRC